MESKVIIIVGDRGTGKTTTVKQLISKVNNPDAILLHDVSAQYKDIRHFYSQLPSPPDFEEFTDKCTKVSNAVIVFEEATIFITHARNADVINFLVTSRHRKNTVVFVFHSFRSVPHFIFDLSNFIIVHKTKDKESVINDRFDDEGLIETFRRVKASPDHYYSEPYMI